MRYSKFFGKTRHDPPCDAESINAKLLTQAGFIEKVAAGIYNLLPLGHRVFTKVCNIIREEMNSVDGQEILMPALHPIDLWEKTGRNQSMDEILYRTTLIYRPSNIDLPEKKTLIQELGNLDMVCMEDDAWSASRKLCAGLMICRCNKNMLKLFSHMKQYFHTDDQISLNNHKNTCKHKTFPTEKFFTVGQVLGRQWQGETNFSIPKKILVHHANWTIGLKNKIKLLEIVKNRVHNRQKDKK